MRIAGAALLAVLAAVSPVAQPGEADLVSLDMGGRVESATSEGADSIGAIRLIDGNPRTYWTSATEVTYPVEIVFSFFGRQPALIQSVTIEPGPYRPARAKDFEIWTSTGSATAGFTKAGAFTAALDGVQSFSIPPVEARYLKLSLLSNYGDKRSVSIAEVRVIEGTRAGYQPLLARNPDLAALVAGRVPDRWAASSARPADLPAAAAMPACRVPRDAAAERPAHAESSNVLVVTSDPANYPPLGYVARKDPKLARMTLRRIRPSDARAALLAESEGIDTIVLSQVCDTDKDLSTSFKQVLGAWVATGHKLVIHDSDLCGGKRSRPPDYGFLPYPFATSNPGALGAHGSALALVEQSALAHASPSHPGYVDIASWKKGPNELGDSNSISQWDAHWCGVLVGENALGVNGFQEAYAHHGRGVIIYNGFDRDQTNVVGYRQLVTRELLVPFDPDPLPCNVPLGQFVITTEARLNPQPMTAGRSYTYPLTLLSNQGYKGRVKLSFAPSPADAGVTGTFQPDAIDVADAAASTLTVTTTAAAKPGARALAVRGVDAAGKTSTLCLALVERKTGGLRIAAAPGSSERSSKNLEIILDASGSMKLALGKSTRIDTARKTLETVLAKIPDDFNVGLRLYGDRYASNQKQTCTDSHLVVPIQKLNRNRILSIVGATRPRGETPLVYSVLQTINDLKAVGGGSVVLITDGEESCHGDPVAAAAALRNSGLDVTLNIVGFTLTAKQSQQALSALASGTGGRFYSAQNGEALGRALLAAAVSRFPYRVLDAAGKQVAAGEAGGEVADLPPGPYKVIVTAGDEEVVADAITVGAGSDVVLTVALKDGRFVIARQ
jgi:hypothetical protein